MAKKKDDYITREDIITLIRRTGVPILTLDRNWLYFFNGDNKSDDIKILEKKVNDALKSQGAVNSKRSELVGLKKQLMKEIMANMEATENSRVAKKMAKSKELIEEINDELVLLEDKELDIPANINKANSALAFSSLQELVAREEKNLSDIESLDKWIDEVRIELKKRILLREKRREENEKIERYLTDTFDMDVLRTYRKYLEERE